MNETLKVGGSVEWKCVVLSDLHMYIRWLYGTCVNCSDAKIQKVMVLMCIFSCKNACQCNYS